MAEIPAFDYDAYPLETKFAWMRSGNGGSASFDACDRLKQLAARLTESDQVVGRNMVRRRLGTQWEGSAASEAGAALDRTAATISAAALTADSGGAALRDYGDSFVATKNAIPAPVVVGQNSFWGGQADEFGRAMKADVGTDFGIQSDYTRRLMAHEAADKAANDALKAHENTARTALATYAAGLPAAGARSKVDDGSSGGTGGVGLGGGVSTASSASGGGRVGAADASAAGGGNGSGTTGSGAAGAGSPGARDDWTPLSTQGASGGGSPSGIVPGPNGGVVPTASAPGQQYVHPPIAPAPSRSRGAGYGGAGYGGAGYAGGYRTPGGPGPLPPRRGAPPVAEDSPGAGGRGAAAGRGVQGGPGGMSPMGMGGGAGGQRRDHRNTSYVPSDEPFRIADAPDRNGFGVSDPVIGVTDPRDEPIPDHERW